MKTEILKNYDEVSARAAEIVSEAIRKKPDITLGLPTGETPIGLYDRLSDLYRKGELDFSRVTTFNLDEYYPIDPENPESYRYFMNSHLFSRVNIPIESTHVPPGNALDPTEAADSYEKSIISHGGVDLQVLGIGRNGHIGFNEPGGSFDTPTHCVTLTESTIEANARLFDSADDVPRRALTMGIGTILSARKILILITGKEKHDALKTLLAGRETPDCPATALLRHPDVTVLVDKAAYGD
ncbi:MAG: glucosamine-6-phosphate deaminase [Lachnospiraceae bacterium]|nr:glucosamine-6-phosphate deaminase [Lachnospiraceae bacterium]